MKENEKKGFKTLTRDQLKNVIGGSQASFGDCYATSGCSTGCARDGVCNTCCYASTEEVQ